MEAYLTEALPRNFVTFLTGRYQSLCIVNNAYPFLINSLNSALLNTHHLFVDIQDRYFDLLITQSNEVKLFNSFTYNSVPDIIYYILRSLKDCRADQSNQHRGALDVDVIVQYVEDVFLGKVGRRSCREIFIGEDLPSPVGTTDYSHLCRLPGKSDSGTSKSSKMTLSLPAGNSRAANSTSSSPTRPIS